MSVAYVSASFDIGDVEKGLEGAQRAADRLAPGFMAAKLPMRMDQATHAAQHTGPESPWAAKAPATLARHSKPRELMGRLPKQVSYVATAESLTGTSRAAWSGGAITTGGRVGHGAILPPREFLWMSDEFLSIAEDIFGDRVLTAYGGA